MPWPSHSSEGLCRSPLGNKQLVVCASWVISNVSTQIQFSIGSTNVPIFFLPIVRSQRNTSNSVLLALPSTSQPTPILYVSLPGSGFCFPSPSLWSYITHPSWQHACLTPGFSIGLLVLGSSLPCLFTSSLFLSPSLFSWPRSVYWSCSIWTLPDALLISTTNLLSQT